MFRKKTAITSTKYKEDFLKHGIICNIHLLYIWICFMFECNIWTVFSTVYELHLRSYECSLKCKLSSKHCLIPFYSVQNTLLTLLPNYFGFKSSVSAYIICTARLSTSDIVLYHICLVLKTLLRYITTF